MPTNDERERAPRRQVESTPAPQPVAPSDLATAGEHGGDRVAQAEDQPEARMTAPWDDAGPARGADLGHQHETQARAAEFENQNLYADVQGPSYGEQHREDDGAYVPPKTPKGDAYRDPAIIGVTHDFFVPLAQSVVSVRTGTPVRPGPNGWEIATDLSSAVAIARAYAEGGTRAPVCKMATLETYERQFRGGDAIGIEYVDDRGAVVWSKGGPFLAINDTQVLVDLTRPGG